MQGELWGTDPKAWADGAESRLRLLYESILGRLNLDQGTRLLGAGCGAGLFVALATGRGAPAWGLDAAGELVAYARKRVPGARFVVGDLEELPFGDGAFDAVTAFNSVPYAAHPERAIAELARVTATSGRVVVTIGTGTESGSCAAMIDQLLPPSVKTSTPSALNLDDPDQTVNVMHDAGLEVCEQSAIEVSQTFADIDEAVSAQAPAGPVTAAARHYGRAAVEEMLRAFFRPRVRRDGTVRLDVAFRCFLGERAQTVGSPLLRRRRTTR